MKKIWILEKKVWRGRDKEGDGRAEEERREKEEEEEEEEEGDSKRWRRASGSACNGQGTRRPRHNWTSI